MKSSTRPVVALLIVVAVVALAVIVVRLVSTPPLSGQLEARDAWMLQWGAEMDGAAYLTIVNGTERDEALVGATTEDAEAVEIHESQMDVGRMVRLEQVMIPAGETVTVSPEHIHLMLIRLKRDLYAGDSIVLTLQFASGASLPVEVAVRETIPNA